MKKIANCGTMNIENGWLTCPNCGHGKILRMTEETRVKNLPVYCKKCRCESMVNIDMSLSQRA